MLHRFRVGQLEVNTVGRNQLIVDPFRHFSQLLQEQLDFKESKRDGFCCKIKLRKLRKMRCCKITLFTRYCKINQSFYKEIHHSIIYILGIRWLMSNCALCSTEDVILSLLKQYNNYEGVCLSLFTLYISLKEEIN